MLAPYVKVRVSTDGKAKLISFEIPGVDLLLFQELGKPLQAFGERPDHTIENLVSAAKYQVDLEMARVAGVRYMKTRVEALKEVKRFMDQLISTDKVEDFKRKSGRALYESLQIVY